ncbi:MAG TPA: prolipoprotein diacylglyceryl transferase [Pirellulaceae bacterium]|nr:prolipoprotein diacylglyceryl transferase [Pirellulaceae bacterium]
MNQTLLWIPHAWIPWPLLWVWLAVVVVVFIAMGSRRGWTTALWEVGPTSAVVAAIIIWGLPFLETPDINPDDPLGPLVVRGLAIRGYGVFLAAGILSAIGLVIWRARRSGGSVETLLSLCFWIIVGGILAARLFYVLQKWNEFSIRQPLDFVAAMADMTRGGLVVYGSFLGALAVTIFFVRRRNLALWPTLDILAPGMTLGLCIGRLGCLMNGCCFGGPCDPEFFAGIQFPPGSPPYMRQLERGTLLGFSGTWRAHEALPLHVEKVEEGSVADRLGIQPGDAVGMLSFNELLLHAIAEGRVSGEFAVNWPTQSQGVPRPLVVSTSDLPTRGLPIHPTQIYASITALLLTVLLWTAFDHRRFPGQVFCLLLILYGVGRYLEESIREDEPGWLGTPFTISQWLSMLGVLVGFTLWCWLSRTQPKPDAPGAA